MSIQVVSHEPLKAPVKFVRRTAFDIKRQVADAFCLSVLDLIGSRKHRNVAQARFVAYDLLQRTQRLSLTQIGNSMGGRHHTTVLLGIRRCDELRATDPDFAARYEEARRG